MARRCLMIPDTGHPNARAVRGFCPRFSFALQAAARGARGASENSSSWASTVRKHGQTGSYARSTMAPIEKTTGGTRMALQGAHQLFGDTDESSCVPDAACAPRRPGAREASEAPDVPDAACALERLGAPGRLSSPDVPDAACAIGTSGGACELKASWMLGAPSSPEAFPLGDYLADAFIAWDFYADAPIPDAPFVLRFSEGDLVAYRALDGELAVWAGAVDTSLPPASLRRDAEDCCPAWVVAGPLSCAFGQRACRAFRAAKDEYVIELEGCSIRLLLEGGMVQAAVCEPRMLAAAAYSSRRKCR